MTNEQKAMQKCVDEINSIFGPMMEQGVHPKFVIEKIYRHTETKYGFVFDRAVAKNGHITLHLD